MDWEVIFQKFRLNPIKKLPSSPFAFFENFTDSHWIYSFRSVHNKVCGPGSSVGIVTGYGLDGPGIESRWGEIFRPSGPAPGAHPASCTMGTGSFPGVKFGPGRAADHSPHFSAVVMEE